MKWPLLNSRVSVFILVMMCSVLSFAQNYPVELVVDNAKGFTQGLTSLFSRKIVKTKGEADILIGNYNFEVPIEQEIEL